MTANRIKICGITRPQDAELCAYLGADYLGLIFAKSPRQVTDERARDLRAAVPGATLVGVFAGTGADAEAEEIARIASDAGLDMLQLHGAESPIFCREIKARTGLPVIKAVPRSVLVALDEERGRGAHACNGTGADYLLLDLDKGTPVTDEAMEDLWNVAADAARNERDIFLAGGLDPWNVRQAVSHTAPFCVDVCRGVEDAPGIKDPVKVKLFIEEVRRVHE